MSARLEQLMIAVEEVAASIGHPVDVDRPYALDEDELPRVTVYSGGEETIDADFGPTAWSEFVRVTPIIEFLTEDANPESIADVLRAAWGTLRAAIRARDWTPYIRDGSSPSYEKSALVIEDRPGVSGFAVTLTFEVELD